MLDTYKHKGLRARLVEAISERGIDNQDVLDAISQIPRHFFVEGAFAEAAYEDKALPTLEGQTISQPFTVAYQTQLLKPKAKLKILEIGTGSGYQAAILCAIGMQVFTVEVNRKLHQLAKERLEDLDLEASFRCGDGSAGWAAHAPYDRILVTAASPSIPEPLKRQLKTGGIMVIPVGDLKVQKMCVVKRINKSEFQVESLHNFKFVPLVGKHGFEE